MKDQAVGLFLFGYRLACWLAVFASHYVGCYGKALRRGLLSRM